MYLYHFEAFTSPCELHLEASSPLEADAAAQSVLSYVKELEYRYSYFSETSEVYALNHRTTRCHTLSDELAGLIALSFFYTERTQGAFDIALAGTLKTASRAPTYSEYQYQKEALLPFATSASLHLNGTALMFLNDITQIDLGGLVKEYAVDYAILQLQNLGIGSALVNFGGDMAAYGSCHGNAWTIGIENPDFPDTTLKEVVLKNNALCTSGVSKRYRIIENEKITSIITPVPSAERYRQVSIIGPTTVDAGVWSTALMVNPHLSLPSHIRLICTV